MNKKKKKKKKRKPPHLAHLSPRATKLCSVITMKSKKINNGQKRNDDNETMKIVVPSHWWSMEKCPLIVVINGDKSYLSERQKPLSTQGTPSDFWRNSGILQNPG